MEQVQGSRAPIQRLVDRVSGYFVPAVALSKATMPNIREYLVFAWIYNSAGIPVAAGVPYSFVGLLLSPMIAAAAMAFSSL